MQDLALRSFAVATVIVKRLLNMRHPKSTAPRPLVARRHRMYDIRSCSREPSQVTNDHAAEPQNGASTARKPDGTIGSGNFGKPKGDRAAPEGCSCHLPAAEGRDRCKCGKALGSVPDAVAGGQITAAEASGIASLKVGSDEEKPAASFGTPFSFNVSRWCGGGGGWIRTSVGSPRRIYSPLHLTALPPLHGPARNGRRAAATRGM